MPAYIFDDNLQSYSPGNGYPNGFQGNGTIFTNRFINGAASPTPSPVGFYENQGIYFSFFGDGLAFPTTPNLPTYSTDETSVAWWAWGEDPQFAPGGLQLISQNPGVPNNVFTLLEVQFQADNSVSLIVPGAAPLNSLAQVFDYFTWTFFSLTAAFSSTVVGGVTVVTVTVSMSVNGVSIFSGEFFASGVPVASLWNTLPSINEWVFPTANYGYLAATTDLQSLPFYPAPGTTINAKSTQMIAEFANLPSPPDARVAQLIVEIVLANFVQGGTIPEYIKSRARPGH
jgi:hypothetical protein